MPDYNGIYAEYVSLLAQENPPSLNLSATLEVKSRVALGLRTKYLNLLADYLGTNVIAYYSTWVQSSNTSNPNIELSICDNDMNGFMNAVSGLDKTKGLSLVLHTPGGGVSATQALANYLLDEFGGNFSVIVPHLAMSAGTMIACSSKVIIMGKHSSLGPIDPQYKGVPAEGVISEFNRAMEEVHAEPNRVLLWREIISKYPPTFIGECQNAIDLSKQFILEKLTNGMFAQLSNKEELAKKVVEFLSHDASKQHDKHYGLAECKKAGLNVRSLEDDQVLQNLVLSVYHSYVVSTYELQNAVKFIDNNSGKSFMITGKR